MKRSMTLVLNRDSEVGFLGEGVSVVGKLSESWAVLVCYVCKCIVKTC